MRNQIKDIYGFEVSEDLVTGITNKLLPEIEAWQKRAQSAVYPIVFIDVPECCTVIRHPENA